MSVIALLTRDATVLAVLREAALDGDHHILAVETPEALSDQVRRCAIELIILDLASFPSDAELLCRRARTLPRSAQAALLCIVSGIYSNERAIKLHGRPVELTPTEFDLLEVLSQQPGEYLTATELLQLVWHYPPGSGDPALVRNHVRNLRRKLENDPDRPRVVTSAHGRGYTLSVDAQRR